MERRRFLAWGLTVAASALSAGCGAGRNQSSPPPQKLRVDEWGYGGADRQWLVRTETPDVRHTASSPQPIRWRVLVTNRLDRAWTFDTADHPLMQRQEPLVDAGLEEPRPAYDLLFVGRVDDDYCCGPELMTPYVWVWSAEQRPPPPSCITLGPGETRVLIDTLWRPPPVRYVYGGFQVRFADVERGTGVGFGRPSDERR
jgi:hypothetical protein